MHSIAFGVGYILIVLMNHVSSYELRSKAIEIRSTPFNFIYNAYNDYLSMEITLKNKPPSVTQVYVIHNNYGKDTIPLKQVNIENNTVKPMILIRLNFTSILLEVELRTKTGVCAKKTVADGRNWESWKQSFKKENGLFDNTMLLSDNTWKHYDGKRTCLAPNKCNIVMDFNNKCQENFTCYINSSQYICTMQNAQPPYTLYQTYNDNSIIGNSAKIEATNLKLILTLELFDANTSVNVAGDFITASKKIPLLAVNGIKDNNVTQFKYSETSEVQFGCQKNRNDLNGTLLYVSVGVINKINNKIKTFYTTLIRKKLTLATNGTSVCCLYYKTNQIASELTITRFVVNKTLLIYQRNESIEKVAYQTTEKAEQVDQAMTSTESNDYSWLLYVFVALTGVSALVVVLSIIFKQRWFKKSQPVEETVESDNQLHQNQVLYADLNFVNYARQLQDQREESHYAQIIGELHPL